MIFSTSGIVLRMIKYGDTSGVITIYTNRFGLQSYLVNGIRAPGKKSKAYLFQPASLLEMEVYHAPMKNLQRIKEARWNKVYRSVFTDVVKNSIALFMVELLQKSIIAEEQNVSLYGFAEGAFLALDNASQRDAADIPVRFILSLPSYLGFGMDNNYDEQNRYFQPEEGKFVAEAEGVLTERSADVNQALAAVLNNIKTGASLHLNGRLRSGILHLAEKYFRIHVSGFTEMKSLKVIEMIFRL